MIVVLTSTMRDVFTLARDQGWVAVKASEMEFRTPDPDSRVIRGVPPVAGAVRSLPRGTEVILGHGWTRRQDLDDINAMLAYGHLIRIGEPWSELRHG